MSCTLWSLNPFLILIFLLLPPSSLKITSITIKLNMIYHIMYYVHCTRITRQWADRKLNNDNRSNARPRRPRRGLRAPLVPINRTPSVFRPRPSGNYKSSPKRALSSPAIYLLVKNPMLSFFYSSDERTGRSSIHISS